MTLFWLAGILEGEGSFLAGPPSSPNCPAIRLPMTDVDVVERVAAIFERAVIATRARKAHHKRAYVTTIKGAGAARMMIALVPLLSQRRIRQIERALRRHGTQPRRRVRQTTRLATDGTILIWETAEPAERIAWLAGLLEGEGSFGLIRESRSSYPVLKVEMCDEEIVARAGHILGVGRIYRRYPKRAEWSITYIAQISGHRAAEWMRRLRPYMGLRRISAINKALAAYHPIRLINVPATCVVSGCERSHRSRGLCHAHYMTWSRDRAKGRAPRVTPLR
ncbi:MAG: hypothetical protein E6J09_11995 [Chloroflexi bacterium]|nr:MAG: hypothetical protein E6J09_11995 [Chloroflexota bacterium]